MGSGSDRGRDGDRQKEKIGIVSSVLLVVTCLCLITPLQTRVLAQNCLRSRCSAGHFAELLFELELDRKLLPKLKVKIGASQSASFPYLREAPN